MSYKSIVVSTMLAIGVLSSAEQASAQGVQWRHDYAAARKEATATGRTLLLDFGTDNCFWCRKLDATTFRDPKIVQVLNDRFIPVKVDANQHEQMTAALGIDGFPTLILATPEGQVAGRHVGYATIAQIFTLLDKAPPIRPAAAPQVGPTRTQPRSGTDGFDPEKQRAIKQRLDADLAALYPKIVASLNR